MGSGPLLRNASGPIVYLDMKLNAVFGEGWRYCVELAASRGLVAFDPQSGAVAALDPTATRQPDQDHVGNRGTGIGARMYRWSSLRSYGGRFSCRLPPSFADFASARQT